MIRIALAAAFAAALSSSALAQVWPDRPIRMLVPFVAGGSSDIVGRMAAAKMSASLGQPVVVDNKPGANGSIAGEMLAKSPPDGYTIMVGSIGVFSINESLYRALPYRALRDFENLTLAVTTPNVLVAFPGFPPNNVKELVDYMKANPNKVNFSSSGNGSSDHLSGELFKQMTNTQMQHVPYKGGAAAQSDLMAGVVQISFQNLGAVTQYIRAGKMKALAVTSAKRAPSVPEVPTAIESGLAGFDVTSWQAFAAPRGTPKPVVQRLHEELVKALTAPDVKERFATMGFDVVANTPEEYERFLRREIDSWRKVVEASGAKLD